MSKFDDMAMQLLYEVENYVQRNKNNHGQWCISNNPGHKGKTLMCDCGIGAMEKKASNLRIQVEVAAAIRNQQEQT